MNQRKESILNVVVQDYISTAEPVGSGTVCRKYFHDLSSATVRSEMSSLVKEGYLQKPHTSSGRVPTDRGYRFYVDSINTLSLEEKETAYIENFFEDENYKMEDLIQASLKIISQLTRKTGIILAPKLNKIILKKIELIRVHKTRLLVVIVGSTGDIFNRHIRPREDLSQEQLNAISRFLNSNYSGLTIPAIKEKVVQEITDEKERYDILVRRSLEICSVFFAGKKEEEELYVAGIENLFDQREFAGDVASAKEVLRALEKRASLVMILDQCLEQDDANIFIGSETGDSETRDCAFIVHNYKCGNHSLGTIGILGHKRMEYPRMISVVNYVAKRLTETLSQNRL